MKTDAKRNMIRRYAILLFVFSPMISPAADSGNVMISGEFPTIGNINLRIVQPLDNPYTGTVLFETNVPADQIQGGIALPELPEGKLTIRVLHDKNADGRMNSNAFGVPTESAVREPFTVGAGTREIRLEPPPADSRAWGAGVMTLYSSNPYKGGERVWRVLPLLTYVGENFYIIGPRAGYNLIKNRWVSANVVAEYIFAGEAFDDSPFLDGMKNRRDTLMSGVDLNLRGIGKWRLEFSATTDVLGRHEGQEAKASIGYGFRGDRWSLSPSLGLIWHSSNYNNYYYGVRSSEATGSRPSYEPGASVEFSAGLFGRFEISDSWAVLASVRGELLSDEIQDSPIVDKETVTSMFLGLNYAF
jgi:outer membrane protein